MALTCLDLLNFSKTGFCVPYLTPLKGEHPSTLSGSDRPMWQEWAMSMPTGGALVDKRRRKRLFEKFDVNGNGYLSLAEVDNGVRDVLQCDRLFHTKPVLIRAFESAKGCDATSGATYGHEYVGRRRNDVS